MVAEAVAGILLLSWMVASPGNFHVLQNSNACYGDPAPCWFRGRQPDSAACQAVCENDHACHSYTWVGQTGDNFALECRTRNDTAWNVVPEGRHTAGYKGPVPVPTPPPTPPPSPMFRCMNATGCNNGGDCVSGRCVCDPTWRGDRCDSLALLPAQSTGNGLQATDPNTDAPINTWGGSIVAGIMPGNGLAGGHHMFASMFLNSTLTDWETKSVVVHAFSGEGVSGPYKITNVVFAPRRDAKPPRWDSLDCHNPTVHRIGAEYVVFYIGVGVPEPGPRVAVGAGADLPQSIGAASSTSPMGPWNRTLAPLLTASATGWECGGQPEPNCGVSNPAVVLNPDGTLLMFYRGNNDRGVGVASAPHWSGPWTKHGGSIFPPDVVVGLEDMYVWRNPQRRTGRPGCHMVLHQECAGVENLGAHAFTEDPSCLTGWTLSNPRPSRAYGPEFSWDNGTVTTLASRERPQIVLGLDGFPTHISNGVITKDWSGPSFTLVAPINTN